MLKENNDFKNDCETISKYYEDFLKWYKNPLTRKLVSHSLSFFENLKKIDIAEINKILDSLNANSRSKNLIRNHIILFIKYLSEREKVYYEYKSIKKNKENISDRKPLTDDECENIEEIIKNVMKNEQFLLIFQLLRYSGLRLSEFVKIKWNELYKNNWSIYGQVIVPENLRSKLRIVKIYYSKNTIQNLFIKLRDTLKKFWPEFKKPISSDILRYRFFDFNNLPNLLSIANKKLKDKKDDDI